MKYILNFDLSILNIFQVLKINGFVNYLFLISMEMFFQCEMKRFENLSFWRQIENECKKSIWESHIHGYFGSVNSLWNL